MRLDLNKDEKPPARLVELDLNKEKDLDYSEKILKSLLTYADNYNILKA